MVCLADHLIASEQPTPWGVSPLDLEQKKERTETVSVFAGIHGRIGG